MTARRQNLGLAALAVAVAAATASAEPLGPADFAHGRAVELRDDAPLQTMLLDPAVYRGSVEPGLADLRVFNGAGEAVPHAIRGLATPHAVAAGAVGVPFFRLPANEPDEASSRSVDTRGTYRIDAEVSDGGAVVRIRSQPEGQASEPGPPAAYLIDTSQLDRPIQALELDLGPAGGEFVVAARVEGSNDLTRFRPLGTRATLARLDQAGHRLDATDIPLPAGRHRYLRLSWPEKRLPVAIESVRVRLSPDVKSPARSELRIPGRALDDERGAFVFDLEGEFPVDRIQVALPSPNTLVEARLFSARSADGPWARHYSGLLYELEHGRRLRNPAVQWPVTRHRYFKLVVSPKGGGLGPGTPELVASWYPEQLLFVARGAPPFRLGYGRHGVAAARFRPRELLATTRNRARELPRETAALGTEYTVAEPRVLRPPPEPVSALTVGLWAVLVLSVGVVLALSLHLLRQMRARAGDEA